MEHMIQEQVNDMSLRFNMNGIINEILNKLEQNLEYAFIAWRTEVLSKLKNPYLGEGNNPEVEYELKKESNKIIGYLKANTYVLADSYGTGSLMLTDNPGFQEYRNSDRWNPARTGKVIVGRPMGVYKDAFGKVHVTSGRLKGKKIEHMVFNNKYKIEPVAPSYALQMAEQWLYKTYLPNAYKNAIKSINFSKYLIES